MQRGTRQEMLHQRAHAMPTKAFFVFFMELWSEASDGDGGVPEACGADDGIDAPAECEHQQHQRHTNVIHAHCVAGGNVGL